MSSSGKSLIDAMSFEVDFCTIVIDGDLAENILIESDVYHLFDEEKLSEFVSNLRELYAIAIIEARRAPRATRTEVNLLLRKLSTRKAPLTQLLADPLASEVMYLAWLDLHATKPVQEPDAGFLSREFDNLDKTPSKLDDLICHFRSRIAEFDKLTKKEQSDWYFNAKSKAEFISRQMLYPFLQRGTPTSAEIYVVRNIAALYEITTGKAFSVTQLEDRTVSGARYAGPGIRFGCVICRALSLSFMEFSKTRPVNRWRPRGTQPHYLDPKTDRHLLINSTNVADDASVANTIGDSWKNDRRLAGPKPLSIYQ
jgi:hypothetical protein